MKKLSFIILLIIVFSDTVNAQNQNFHSRKRNRTLMFSYGLGGVQYHGDLHDVLYDGMNAATGYSFGIGLRKKYGDQLSIRLDLNHYQIGGDDAENQGRVTNTEISGRGYVGNSDDRYLRNLRFTAKNWEISALLNFNVKPFKGFYSRRPKGNLYIIGGIGYTTSNPKAQDPVTGIWENLRLLKTEYGFNPGEQEKFMRMVIPLGIGIRLKANQYIDVLLEGARRFTFTDYLDDISTIYPTYDALLEAHDGNVERAEVAYRMSNRSGELEDGIVIHDGAGRGNSENNDAYYIFQIRLEMYLPDSSLSNLFSPNRRKAKFR